MGFDQHNPHHLYDIYTHTAHVTAGVPGEPALRWAALLHDIAKPAAYTLDSTGCGHFYGHARESAGMADAILRRLKAPTALRERVVLLIGWHMDPLTPEKPLLRRRLSQMGSGALWALLALQRADAAGTGTSGHADFDAVAAALRELEAEEGRLSLKELAVNGRDMMALGFSGPEIGRRLNALLSMVLDEQLPNEKQALLAAAAEL